MSIISNTVLPFAFNSPPLSFNIFDGVDWEEEMRKYRVSGEGSDDGELDVSPDNGSSSDTRNTSSSMEVGEITVTAPHSCIHKRREDCAPICTHWEYAMRVCVCVCCWFTFVTCPDSIRWRVYWVPFNPSFLCIFFCIICFPVSRAFLGRRAPLCVCIVHRLLYIFHLSSHAREILSLEEKKYI